MHESIVKTLPARDTFQLKKISLLAYFEMFYICTAYELHVSNLRKLIYLHRQNVNQSRENPYTQS